MITLFILRLLAVVFLCWVYWRQCTRNQKLEKIKELWKVLELAREVQIECIQDFYTVVNDEGCMTRKRRREKDVEQSDNAEDLAAGIKTTLVELGEYKE